MKIIGNIFTGLFTLVILLMIAGFIFLKTFDLNSYKGLIEKVAEENLGRKLTIAGDASIAISLIPTIVLNDISLANPLWAKKADMLEVKSVELEFSILPLLQKQIVIAKAELDGARIYLETAKDGQNNWDFDLPKPEMPKVASGGWFISEANAAELVDESDFKTMLTSLVAEEVVINNASLQYFEQKSGKLTKLEINSIVFSMDGFDNPMNVEWNAVFDGVASEGTAKTGSINQIMDERAEFPLEASVKVMNIKADIKAKISEMLLNPRVSFDVIANNPAGNFGVPAAVLQTVGSFADNKINLDISSLNVAKNIVKGKVFIDIAPKLPFIRANLNSNKIDLRAFEKVQKKADYIPEFISAANASEMIPNDKIPFERLRNINADVRIAVKSLIVTEALQAQNLQMNVGLNNGILNLSTLKLNFGGGEIDIIANVNANKQSVALNLSSKNVLIQDLHREFRVSDENDFGFLSGGETQIFADLSGSGATYRQLVDSLKGPFIAIVEKSEVQAGRLQFINANIISQLFEVLKLDSKKQKKFKMKCAVVRADFADGKVIFPKGIAVDSKKLTMVSNGNLNLHNDKLNLTLNAYGTGIADVSIMQALSNLILIKGTLQSPKITLDAKNAMKTIATAAFIPGAGPAVVGAQMVLDKDQAPCYTALQGTKYSSYFAKPKGVSVAAQGSYKDASQIVNDGVDKVGGLGKDAKKFIKSLFKKDGK